MFYNNLISIFSRISLTTCRKFKGRNSLYGKLMFASTSIHRYKEKRRIPSIKHKQYFLLLHKLNEL
jgi:hypothetical protein